MISVFVYFIFNYDYYLYHWYMRNLHMLENPSYFHSFMGSVYVVAQISDCK
jgi:hypothetical protein